MNYIFFLIPFILVASIGIYQDVFAAQQITGYNYFDVINPDGSHKFTTHDPYVFDGNNWVPFINSGNTVQTAIGIVTLNGDGSYTWDGKFTDKIIAKYSDVSDQVNWTYPNTLNNDTPDISWDGSQFTSSKIKSGVGQLDYKYVLVGDSWKTQLEATNLSVLTTKVFGFDQIIDLNRDTIKFGGVIRNLDNFNGTTFDKQFLDNNKGRVLDLLNGISFDFDLGYDNLYSVTVYDTGENSSRLVFDYRTNIILMPGVKLIIDPTYSSNNPTTDGYTVDGNNDICDSGSAGTTTGSAQLLSAINPIASTEDCYFAFLDYDISSIPSNSIVTDVDFLFDLDTATNPRNCDYVSMGTTRGSDTGANIWTAINGGTVMLDNDATCTVVGDNTTVDFGSVGDTAVQARVTAASGFFTFGIKPDDLTLDASSHTINFVSEEGGGTPSPTLVITYSDPSPPNPITLISYQGLTSSAINLNWTAPNFGAGTFQNYTANYTSPWGQPVTFLGNTTNTYINMTGLVFGTDYSVRVAAATEIQYNTTGSYILNFTTTTTTYSLPPTNFLMLPNGTSTSVLLLNWTAPLMNNLNGYRIQCEAPVGGGFSTVTANTTTTTNNYNYTGLSVNTYYNCKVAGLNGTGMTDYSNTYSQTTYHLSDAVTTLSVTMTDVLSAILTWVQPVTLYGYLTGYQINYTTPTGDPQTIYLASTGSSAVTYTVTGLTSGDAYSFRVSPITIHGKNTTFAQIANGTAFSNFDVGSIYLPTGDNPVSVPIEFELITVNSTTSDLQVTYDSSYSLACDFSYPISQSNTTYSGLTETAISGSSVYSNFTLNGYGDELIDVYCWDLLDNSTNGRERLGTTSIPLVGQVNSFQTGAFGTSGMFGAIDLLTLIVIIISMIGFNRTHPIVGVAFMAVFIGAMTYYRVIAEQTTYLGAIALLVALAIIYGRRDDAE